MAFFVVRFTDHPESGLPDLPQTLLLLSGASATAYLAKKAATREAPPVLTAVFPSPVVAGEEVTIIGRNLLHRGSVSGVRSDPDTPSMWVLVGGQSVPTLRSDATGQLDVLVVKAPDAAGKTDVVVLTKAGAKTVPMELTVR